MTLARRRTRPAVRSGSTITTGRDTTEVAWQNQAACKTVDAELFFPVGSGPSAEPAKAVCQRCPVMPNCRAWALETGQTIGVWGGLTEDELKSAHNGQCQPDATADTEVADRLATTNGPQMLAWLDETDDLNKIARRLGRRDDNGRLTGVPPISMVRLAYRILGVPMSRLKHRPTVERVMDEWPLVQELRQEGVGQNRIARRLGVHVTALREAIQLVEQRQLDEASDRTAVAS